MMVAIDQIFASSANSGIQNIVIGMPHRYFIFIIYLPTPEKLFTLYI